MQQKYKPFILLIKQRKLYAETLMDYLECCITLTHLLYVSGEIEKRWINLVTLIYPIRINYVEI